MPRKFAKAEHRGTEDLSGSDLWAIDDLAAKGADKLVASEGDRLGSTEELRLYFSRYLREKGWILPQVREVRSHPSFTTLVNLGCDPDQLVLLLCQTVGVPGSTNPQWEYLVPVHRRHYQSYINRIGSIARDVQVFISRGGLSLGPQDLTTDLEKLPSLLLSYSDRKSVV